MYDQQRYCNVVPAAGTAAAGSLAVKHPTLSPLGALPAA